jgi:hypothetical protein
LNNLPSTNHHLPLVTGTQCPKSHSKESIPSPYKVNVDTANS